MIAASNRKLWVLLALALCSSVVMAQPFARILSVEFEGNRELSERRLRNWMGWNRGDLWNRDALGDKVQNLLESCQDQGYYFARVDSTREVWMRDSSRVRLEVYFYEGGRTRIGSLEVLGDTLFGDVDIEDLFHSRIDGMFRRDVFYRDIDVLLEWYEDRGFPFCRVEPVRVDVDSGTTPQIHIGLEVKPGPLVHVGFLSVDGNVRTRRHVITREARIPQGAVYRQRDADRSVRRLRRLGFFSQVDDPVIVKDEEGRWGLYYRVVEMPTYRLDGVVGYFPGSDDRDGYFSGAVDIVLANLMGTGRLAEAHWTRQGPGVQELSVRYEEPWVLGFPVTLGLGFRQRVEDTLYVQRSWDIGLEWPITDIVSVWGMVSREEVLPDSSGREYLDLDRSSAWSGELGVTVDSRDEPMNPRSGYYYQSSGSAGLRDIEGDGEDALAEHRVSLDVEGVWEPFRFWVFDVQGHGREYSGAEEVVALPNLFRLGGASSLRGYREEQFLGHRIGWTNVEWRRILGRLSRAFVFVDAGYYYRQVESADGAVETIDDFLVGWGIGLRVETRVGVVGFDYGLGEGDRITNGKVHFRLANQF